MRHVAPFLLLALLAAAVATPVGADWPEFRHDSSNTGYDSDAVVPSDVELVRSTLVGGQLGSSDREFLESSPVVYGKRVYVGGEGIQALKAGETHALTAEEVRLWRYGENRTPSTPAVRGRGVFVGTNDSIVALEDERGEEVWRYSTGSWVRASPTVENGVVFAADDSGTVYALGATSGDVVWQFEAGSPVKASAAVADGVVYVAELDGILHALDASTGGELWSRDVGSRLVSSPAVQEDVYLGTLDGGFLSLDPNGGLNWRSEIRSGVVSSPAVTEDAVYVGGMNGSLYAFDRSGRELWRFETGSSIKSSPAVTEEGLVFGSGDGYLYGVSREEGAEVWSVDLGSKVISSPAVADGRVFVKADGELEVLASPEPADHQEEINRSRGETTDSGDDGGSEEVPESATNGSSDGDERFLGDPVVENSSLYLVPPLIGLLFLLIVSIWFLLI